MDLTKVAPPTDNLYKFLALFGLVVLIASALLYYQSSFDFRKYHTQYIYELSIQGEAHRARMKEDGDRTSKLFDQAYEADARGDADGVRRALSEAKKRSPVPSFSELPDRKRAEADRALAVEKFGTLGLAATVGLLVGAALSTLGFYLWYVRVQVYLDRELKEKVQRKPLRARLAGK